MHSNEEEAEVGQEKEIIQIDDNSAGKIGVCKVPYFFFKSGANSKCQFDLYFSSNQSFLESIRSLAILYVLLST